MVDMHTVYGGPQVFHFGNVCTNKWEELSQTIANNPNTITRLDIPMWFRNATVWFRTPKMIMHTICLPTGLKIG